MQFILDEARNVLWTVQGSKTQTTEEGVQKILLDRFIPGLYSMLHISEDESRATPETGLTELGIDSLVAVEI